MSAISIFSLKAERNSLIIHEAAFLSFLILLLHLLPPKTKPSKEAVCCDCRVLSQYIPSSIKTINPYSLSSFEISKNKNGKMFEARRFDGVPFERIFCTNIN